MAYKSDPAGWCFDQPINKKQQIYSYSAVMELIRHVPLETWHDSEASLTCRLEVLACQVRHNIFVTLTYAAWGLGKMFTKLRFQSRSKQFWSRWLIKQYAIIVRSCLINIHNRIYYQFSTFSEYCERSTWQFGTNVSIKYFGVYPNSLLSDVYNVYYAVQIAVLTTKYEYVQHKYTNRSKYEIWC